MQLILLPGFDGTGMLYAPFLRVLPSEMVPHVISYPTNRICSADELLGIVLSHLPKSEPYILLAESFSGPIALKASALHQNPPAALILCASFGICPLPRIANILLWICVGVLVRCRPPRWLIRRYLLGEASEEIISLFYAAISAVSPCVLAQRFKVLLEFDEKYTPLSLKIPLLYLQATRDHLVSVRNAGFLQHRYPAMQIMTVESPHLILQIQPNDSVKAISDFLNSMSIIG
jgi:pimeloyl-[acyl-carrier protein] methyl ester esterase